MPNHVTTRIVASHEAIESITQPIDPSVIDQHRDVQEQVCNRLSRIGEDHERKPEPNIAVNFNLIIPQPDNIETGPCNMGNHTPDIICWYRWNIENWGTKWGAYQCRVTSIDDQRAHLRLETASNHPLPVVIELSKGFPAEIMCVAFANAGNGPSVGIYAIRNGQLIQKDNIIEGSQYATHVARNILSHNDDQIIQDLKA